MTNLKEHIKILFLILLNLLFLTLLILEDSATWSENVIFFGYHYEKQIIFPMFFDLFFMFLSYLSLKKITFIINNKKLKIILYFINYFIYLFGFFTIIRGFLEIIQPIFFYLK